MQLAVEFCIQSSTRRNSGNAPIWFKGTSHNISAGGILFSPEGTAPELAIAAPIQLRLLMPAELNPTPSARARCVGRIVRIEPASAASPMRIAATIDRYKFERPRERKKR